MARLIYEDVGAVVHHKAVAKSRTIDTVSEVSSWPPPVSPLVRQCSTHLSQRARTALFSDCRPETIFSRHRSEPYIYHSTERHMRGGKSKAHDFSKEEENGLRLSFLFKNPRRSRKTNFFTSWMWHLQDEEPRPVLRVAGRAPLSFPLRMSPCKRFN